MEAVSTARSHEEALRLEETKRRKREGVVILVATLMVLAFAYFEVQAPEVSPEYSLSGNIAFFALSLVPTLLLFTIAGGFVTRSFERWFDLQVETALQGSLEIGQTYYQNSANNALFYARQLSRRITEEELFNSQRVDRLKEFVRSKQREYNLGTVELFSPDRQPLVVAFNEQVPTGVTVKPENEFLNRALQISRSYEQYKYLASLKTPVKNSYILTLLLITLVIIFAATWFGLYLAKGITVPIQRLAEGTHEVAQGNWDYQIESSGDDEIGTLVGSFNQMTQDLKLMTLEIQH